MSTGIRPCRILQTRDMLHPICPKRHQIVVIRYRKCYVTCRVTSEEFRQAQRRKLPIISERRTSDLSLFSYNILVCLGSWQRDRDI
jgi:hypothetical protein